MTTTPTPRRRPTGPCARPGCTNKATYLGTGLCEKHHAYARRNGTLPPQPTDRVAPPTAHVQALLNQGYTISGIATAAGVPFHTVKAAANNTRPIYRDAHDTILNANPDNATYIPGWRATRRLRALAAAGHRLATIAEHTNLNPTGLHDITAGKRTTVENTTFHKINDYWTAHKDDPVTTPDPRINRYQWAAPWEWDDIDDPDTDLHGDAKVDATSVRQAITRAINTHGARKTADILGYAPHIVYSLRTATTVHQSRRAHVLATLNHHERNNHRHRHEQEAA